jgi:hypothetical protein
VLEILNELIDEMDLAEEAIVASAVQHIHSNEVIMTFGLSQTTLKFLMRAAERRTFQVWQFPFCPSQHPETTPCTCACHPSLVLANQAGSMLHSPVENLSASNVKQLDVPRIPTVYVSDTCTTAQHCSRSFHLLLPHASLIFLCRLCMHAGDCG